MTVSDYHQLKAFARVDGLKLFVLWLASFICCVTGLRSAFLSQIGMVLMLATPFYVARLLRRFRDEALDGVISFRRAWAYVVFVFFYASLLFALAQFVYFSYMDHGQFVNTLSEMMYQPDMVAQLKRMGMEAQMSETLAMMRAMRPIDLVFNVLTTNLFVGLIVGLPLAGIYKRQRVEKVN